MSGHLPEGYKELEYIKHKPSKAYILGGFSSQDMAAKRIDQLQRCCRSSAYSIGTNVMQTIREYVIAIPEEAIRYLSDPEKSCIVELKRQLSFIEYSPVVYRFISEKYVDSFFESGALRLSTFRRCAKLEDANRKDETEGRAHLIGHEREIRFEMDMGVGDNAILLCSSLSINNVKANGQVDDCCIEIRDVNGFVNSITNALLQAGQCVHTVMKGPCVYSNRTIESNLESKIAKSILEETKSENSFDFGKLFQLGASVARDDIFFCKPIENRFENEYRMLWLLEDDITQETFDVVVPDARQFCRKIKFDNNNLRIK